MLSDPTRAALSSGLGQGQRACLNARANVCMRVLSVWVLACTHVCTCALVQVCLCAGVCRHVHGMFPLSGSSG